MRTVIIAIFIMVISAAVLFMLPLGITFSSYIFGIVEDVVTAVCSGITNFLLWIQRKGR